MHVRRGDVVLHVGQVRRYFAIEEYMKAAMKQQLENTNNNSMTILLLTDDANAVIEAKTLYPNHTWITIDRKRYKGSQGGWEGHFPSQDPLQETIILLGTFKLVEMCNILIHTESNLAQLFYGTMITKYGKNGVTRVQVD